jgi:hypothetical protein
MHLRAETSSPTSDAMLAQAYPILSLKPFLLTSLVLPLRVRLVAKMRAHAMA